MNILIIEDEKFLAERIGKVFHSKVISNRIRILYSYDEFIEEIPILSSYDLVLTDLKLNHSYDDLSWYRIIQTIRGKWLHVPIVVISGMGEVENIRVAFDLGANDYLIKPLRLKELEIRVMNWFKNHYLSQISFRWNIYNYHGLTYDIGKNEFSFDGALIVLTKKNKYLLSVFFSHPEQIIGEDFLVERIWGDRVNTENRPIRVNILRLKQALEPFGISKWLLNVRGEWYIFAYPE